MPAKKACILLTLTLVLAFVSSMALAAPMTSNDLTLPKAYSTGAFGTNEVLPGKSPTTGLDFAGEYRPLVVQIENHPGARPHLNMSEADVVYEGIYWGPYYTRYTAIFNDNHPDYVASIRSARLHHCVIRQEWDAPFVFYGGQFIAGPTNMIDYFKTHEVTKEFLISGVGITGAGGSVARTSDDGILNRMGVWKREDINGKVLARANPHDAVANLQRIVSDFWPTNEDGSAYTPRSHAFRFGDTPSRGSNSAARIDIVYGNNEDYAPSYTFNSATRAYERWYAGEEQYDGMTGKRLEASNVIVQFVDLTYASGIDSRPLVAMVGSGPIQAFIDGQMIIGTWTKTSDNTRTIFSDPNGEELTLLPGKTYIQMLPWNTEYTYTDASGTQHTLSSGSDKEEQVLEVTDPDEMLMMEEEG